MTLGLVVLSLAVLIFTWLFARSLFRWFDAVTVCDNVSARNEVIAIGVLLAGALLILFNAMALL